ncbi:tetratricopeptide repeat protein [Agaribacter flavus]|uniref:Tetratricopeptide repeat protein n=1 Tax=Agaribacter flavus TaxID=1902781 RepID=A0ABV7FR67_9ALTE
MNRQQYPPTFSDETLTNHARNELLHARYLISLGDYGSLIAAKAVLEKIVDRQPNFGLVYTDLVNLELKLLDTSKQSPVEMVPKFRTMLERQYELEGNSPELLLALANLEFNLSWDIDLAQKYHAEAVSLAPFNPQVHFQYAQFLMKTSRFNQALDHIYEYIKLDPTGYSRPNTVWIYTMMGELDLAEAELKNLEDVDGESAQYNFAALTFYEANNDAQSAFKTLLKILRDNDYSEQEIHVLTQRFAQTGLQGVYHWLLDEKQEASNVGHGTPPLSYARYAINAGEKERAIKFMLQAIDQRQRNVVNFTVDPIYESIRSAPELQPFYTQLRPNIDF